MTRNLMLCTVVGLLALGCAQAPAPTAEEAPAEPVAEAVVWQPVTIEEMTEIQNAQHARSMAAKDRLVQTMMGELSAALDEGGPQAIHVCRDTAPAVGAQIQAEHGVLIGRTSHKLRNPANTAPAWAEVFVADMVAEPVFLAGPNGELGSVLPIKLQSGCTMCHGTTEDLSDEMMTAVAESYPEDQAIGFVEGDLRGWLWVEAPAEPTEEAPTDSAT